MQWVIFHCNALVVDILVAVWLVFAGREADDGCYGRVLWNTPLITYEWLSIDVDTWSSGWKRECNDWTCFWLKIGWIVFWDGRISLGNPIFEDGNLWKGRECKTLVVDVIDCLTSEKLICFIVF